IDASTLPPLSRRTGADRVATWAMRISVHGLLEQGWEHLMRAERLLGQAPRRPPVAFVIAIDPFDARERFTRILERRQALANRKPVGEASVRDQHRPPAGEVTHAPITKPTAAHLHITVLRDTELRARALDEFAIQGWRLGNDFARHDRPAVASQHLRFAAHLGEAKGLRRALGKIEIGGEFAVALPIP